MVFVARGEIKLDQLGKVFETRKNRRASKRVKVMAEVFVIGQPWIVAIFEAETSEEVMDFVAPYLEIGTFEIYPAMTVEEAQKIF